VFGVLLLTSPSYFKQLEQELLTAIPAWEAQMGRSFLVHGERILEVLREAIGGQENLNPNSNNHNAGGKRKAAGYVPGTTLRAAGKGGEGVVTPAVRPGSSLGTGPAGAKRQRVDDVAGEQRVVLGVHRGNGHQSQNHQPRAPSPVKGMSSLPRPVVVPKAGTPYFGLGHGRVPSVQQVQAQVGVRTVSGVSASASAMSGGFGAVAVAGRVGSRTGKGADGGAVRKTSRPRGEGFRPRPSADFVESGMGGCHGHAGWKGGTVEEEDEG
jgi:protein regulator of cytokinesis 1